MKNKYKYKQCELNIMTVNIQKYTKKTSQLPYNFKSLKPTPGSRYKF